MKTGFSNKFNTLRASTACLLFLFWAAPSFGAQVLGIQIQGELRIKKEAILEKVGTLKNSELSEAQVRKDILSIHGMGYFKSVKADLSNSGVLTYIVSERPVIQKLSVSGNSEIDEEEVLNLLGLKLFQIYDESQLKIGMGAIKKKYEEEGFFLAETLYETESLQEPKNSIHLKIKIVENRKIKVKRISILGNKKLSDEKVKKVLMLKPAGFFGTGGTFRADILKRDQEMIRLLYLNEAFAKVKVAEPLVSMTPDKSSIEVSFRVEEGDRYQIGEVSFSGEFPEDNEVLLEEITVDDQEFFSQAQIIKDIDKLKTFYGDQSYAYVNISPRPRFNGDDKTVDLNFFIERGPEISVGRIDIIGNTKTHDKVIRRQLKLFESESYNRTHEVQSLAKLKRLGYFENVELQKLSSAESSDVMDLNVLVAERSTGQINAGAGYGGLSGFSLQGSISEANALGRGESLSANINWSTKHQKLFAINYTEPYFLDTPWSLGFDLYRSLRRFPDFDEDRWGGSVRVGRRFYDHWNVVGRYRLDHVSLDLGANPDRSLYPVVLEKEAEGFVSAAKATISYDTRDDQIFPTDGIYSSVEFEYAGLGGNIGYTEASFNFRFYQPLYKSLTWRNNITYSILGDNFSGDSAPINELYRLGGVDSLRGHDYFSVSKRKFSQQRFNQIIPTANATTKAMKAFGGLQQYYFNSELEWFLVREAKIKGVVFYDVGYADDRFNFDELRSSVGFGVRWYSPFGPLRLEIGFPINPNKDLGEKSSDFELAIKGTF